MTFSGENLFNHEHGSADLLSLAPLMPMLDGSYLKKRSQESWVEEGRGFS